MVEEDDPVLTPYLRSHITNKLHPVILLLRKIQGVSEDVAIPKQGGDEDKTDKSDDNDGDNVPEKSIEKENIDDTADVSKNDKGEGTKKPGFSTITNPKKPRTQESADDIQKPKADWFEKMNVGDTSSGPSKRKGKNIREDDVDENLDMSEDAKLARAAREKELDELIRITKQLDAEDAAKRQAELDMQARQSLFPDWDYETMKSEAITH
ncbi:hypothetical protein L2E82_10403 [Cichorium intybus]|uniref:Uncharacterized protein n=1 Tax=Cichorium intybus TaxID=13427 RepID=A0ACB9GAL2_CICIN|nr:hypothetical protein L2E82_10403 [Cichorium intybus]